MLFAGLFCTTFATLLLEILDSRLLSVLTWYHLSFLAVSLAMLGMAGGAIHVSLGGPALGGDAALRRLPRVALAFAVTMALSHVVVLCIPLSVQPVGSVIGLASLATTIVALTVPFYFSGMAVTIALTRGRAAIGHLYAWDLAGAAFGCLAVVPLLDSGRFNLSSLVLLGAAVASAGGWCFSQAFATRSRRITLLVAMLLATAAMVNGARITGLEIAYPKNRQYWMSEHTDRTYWNSHSYVVVQRPGRWEPFLWGGGRLQNHAERVNAAWMVIDGEAGTPITEWNGDPMALDWVRHDVTTLPYYLRHGSVAVIGFGGGRDLLAAIWGRNTAITGIDVNQTMIGLLTGSHRQFARIADRPDVRLVHDDGRSFLTRSAERFDVIQMSLIDTWAATGAGAFSLSENGLYTTEAWGVVLSRLAPTGVFSVSRWFAPGYLSETSRLLALGTAALIQHGAGEPKQHMLLVSRGAVATLMISPSPFTDADRGTIERVAADEAFTIQLSPWTGGSTGQLDRIASSSTAAALMAATADPQLDFSPPTDDRPFFFNMLKPAAFARAQSLPSEGVARGNIYATTTLVVLFLITMTLVALMIVGPLLAHGRPRMPARAFAASLVYFAGIGLGFMLVQMALLQRFSIYLGHPTHTLSITLFSMILFAGIGSYLSDLVVPRRPWLARLLPVVAAGGLLLLLAAVQPLTRATIGYPLAARSAIVVGLLAPLSMLLGCFFPTGLRLVSRLSPEATPWMWGVNGAFSVLGSIVAVAISIFVGIHANLLAAAALYGALVFPLTALQRANSAWPMPAEDVDLAAGDRSELKQKIRRLGDEKA
jgi:hypothetical protein